MNRHRPPSATWNVTFRPSAYVWVSDDHRGYGTTRQFRTPLRVVKAFLDGYQLNGCAEAFQVRVHFERGVKKGKVFTFKFVVRDGQPYCV